MNDFNNILEKVQFNEYNYQEQCNKIFENIISSDLIANGSHWNSPQSLLYYIADDKQNIEIYTRFILNLYKFSNSEINITNTLDEIKSQSGSNEIIIDNLLKYAPEIELSNCKDYMVNEVMYSEKHLLLLKKLIEDNNTKTQVFNESQLKMTINNLIDKIFNLITTNFTRFVIIK